MTRKETAVFCRKLSFMLNAGMSVKAAVKVIKAQSPGRVKRALGVVDTYISQGDSFSKAIAAAGIFPKLLCGLISLGERTGRLPDVAEQAADYYEEYAETETEMISALAYPAVVSLLMFSVMIMAVTFVLPSYEQVFSSSDAELPFITQLLLNVSAFFKDNVFLLMTSLCGFSAILFLCFKSTKGAFLLNGLLLYLPLYKKFINARFSQALSLMLSAGQSVAGTLPACAEVLTNRKVREDLRLSAIDVSSGKPLWEALTDLKYIDSLLKEMIRVGEETGRLAQAVSKSREYFQREYSFGIKRLNKLIEPALTIVLGAMVGMLMLAVVLPTFRLTDIGW